MHYSKLTRELRSVADKVAAFARNPDCEHLLECAHIIQAAKLLCSAAGANEYEERMDAANATCSPGGGVIGGD